MSMIVKCQLKLPHADKSRSNYTQTLYTHTFQVSNSTPDSDSQVFIMTIPHSWWCFYDLLWQVYNDLNMITKYCVKTV